MHARFVFLLSASLLLALEALAQPEPDTSQWPDGRPGADFNVTDADGLKQGRWIRVYPNGKLYYSGSFQDGRPVGHFTFFRENGRVLSEVDHQEDSDLASAILYRDNGSVSFKGQYQTVQVEGEWTQWKTGEWTGLDPQGRIRLSEHYHRDTLHGAQEAFHANGQLLEQGSYAMGLKTGLWSTFDREGLPLNRSEWADGLQNGTTQVFQKGGKLLSEGRHEQGLPTGEWTTYNPDGKVRLTTVYEGGRAVTETPQNGMFSSTYPSGRPEWEGRYAFGSLNGPFTAWHDLGEWVMVPAESGGPATGPQGRGAAGPDEPMKRELRDQPKKETGTYRAGVKDGTWRYFDEEGETIRTEKWVMGRLKTDGE